MRLDPATREFVLFFMGIVGLASYVLLPDLRDPLLLPVYGAMIGLPIVINRDKAKQDDGDKKE